MKKNWTRQEIEDIYNQPFLDLVYQAATVHRENHNPNNEDTPVAETVASSAAHKDEPAKQERIGIHHPLQRLEAGV